MKRNLQSAGLQTAMQCRELWEREVIKYQTLLFPLQIEIESGIVKNLRKYYWSLMPGSARGLPGH